MSRPIGKPMHNQHGFTLLEVMVAVALLAMLGLAAALTLNSSIRSEQLVGRSLETLQRLQRTQQLMRRDLEQMVARQGRSEQGDSREQALLTATAPGQEPDVLLDFYKTGRRILTRQPPGAHLERVRYRLRGGTLYRDSSPYPDAPPGERWHSAALMEGLEAVEIRYFHQQEWLEQWPTADPATLMQLPRGMQLNLVTERYGPVAQTLLLPAGL